MFPIHICLSLLKCLDRKTSCFIWPQPGPEPISTHGGGRGGSSCSTGFVSKAQGARGASVLRNLTAFQVSLLDLQLCPFATKADKKVSNHFRKGSVWQRKKLCFFSQQKLPASEIDSPGSPWCLLLQGKCYFCFMPSAHPWGAGAAVARRGEGAPILCVQWRAIQQHVSLTSRACCTRSTANYPKMLIVDFFNFGTPVLQIKLR